MKTFLKGSSKHSA